LHKLFKDEISGMYGLAQTKNIPQVIDSFGRYATRNYDRQFVSDKLRAAISATVDVVPKVSPCKLTPAQTIGVAKGPKSSGFLCLGTKYKFHSRYLTEMVEALEDPSCLMECVPIYVIISKDEVRDKTKPCRDLAFPPVWFSDLATMYEKDFFLTTMAEWHHSPIKLGIPIPQGWPQIVDSLLRYRTASEDFWLAEWDASQFDRSHPLEVTISWHDLMALMSCFVGLNPADKRVLAYIAFWSCIRLVYLPDGRIVVVSAGIYSGDISTSNKNTYFHIIRLALCWIHTIGSISGFRRWVATSGLCLFGDDGVASFGTPESVRFLSNLPSAWNTLFGATLKVHQSRSISGVSFLGKRSLGDDHFFRYVPVSSDLDRQISSLVLKGKKSMTPAQHLSKLFAHRLLLCGYAFDCLTDDAETNQKNFLGRVCLDKVDLAIQKHIDKYSKLIGDDPEWLSLIYPCTCPATELFSYQLVGRDVLFPETPNGQ